ncbi:zinc finger CCCH domain-containing protein 38-like [Trifolium medium]|uniref:Zinc finger CCCH domain-containing protein 38-like n=1 Tax=Trifolium medium TaxID=97028 RepID=A0A392N9N0_9FABA|nr:zinc finger CCCH domain-containing protein 38-like [Trifolium medium]
MSGTGRKRSSKWDLSDEHKQMRSGWSSADVAGNNSSKWAYSDGNDKLRPVMGYSSKESFSGGRGSYEDDAMNEDHRILDTRREWDTDGSYSKKMSPWQEEWEQKRRSQSPINGWSRTVLWHLRALNSIVGI